MKKVTMLLGLFLMIGWLAPLEGHSFDRPDPKTSAVLKALGASPGGVGFVLLTAMAKVVKDTYPRVEITVVPGGFVGNIPRVDKGEGDLGSTTVDLCAMAEKKKEPFHDLQIKNAMALLNVQNPFNYFVIVRKDLPVDTVGDLFTKKLPIRLCTLNKGTATELVYRNIFAAKGMTWGDISEKWKGRLSFVSWADAVNLIKDGHADGILAVGADKIGWAMDLAHARQIKVLKWDKDILDMVREKFGLGIGALPANAFPGVDKDVVVPFSPCEVVVNRRVPGKVVHAILTAMQEREKEFAATHSGLANFKAVNMAKNLGLPLHPAASEYYKARNLPMK
ncbi:MAG: TAXI family TRAP transporter solute-binding subunit [Deltaproteobacteria bacterium]|nr:TAXI family TRAP transporter solute-binding subunit [Deltaproteobacteria bacterium]